MGNEDPDATSSMQVEAMIGHQMISRNQLAGNGVAHMVSRAHGTASRTSYQ